MSYAIPRPTRGRARDRRRSSGRGRCGCRPADTRSTSVPTRSRASSTTTSLPAWRRRQAALIPANPAPTTQTSASSRCIGTAPLSRSGRRRPTLPTFPAATGSSAVGARAHPPRRPRIAARPTKATADQPARSPRATYARRRWAPPARSRGRSCASGPRRRGEHAPLIVVHGGAVAPVGADQREAGALSGELLVGTVLHGALAPVVGARDEQLRAPSASRAARRGSWESTPSIVPISRPPAGSGSGSPFASLCSPSHHIGRCFGRATVAGAASGRHDGNGRPLPRRRDKEGHDQRRARLAGEPTKLPGALAAHRVGSDVHRGLRPDDHLRARPQPPGESARRGCGRGCAPSAERSQVSGSKRRNTQRSSSAVS